MLNFCVCMRDDPTCEHAAAVVCVSGVISSFASYVCKTLTGRLGPSLGAVSIKHLQRFILK